MDRLDGDIKVLDRSKLRTLVHYICYKCHDPSLLGPTMLNKVLWYSDILAYMYTGKPITNETYVKQQNGPVPLHLQQTMAYLEQNGAIAVRKADYFGRDNLEYIALNRPDIQRFAAEEISIVDAAIEEVCKGQTAHSINHTSYENIWNLAEIGEKIPYETAFIGELGEVDKEDVDWAVNEINKVKQGAA